MKLDLKNNKEFRKLRNSIAIKTALKILLYSIIAFLALIIFIDFLAQNQLASSIYEFSPEIYYFLVANKTQHLMIAYTCIFIIITVFQLYKLMNYIVEIITAMDKILKDPNQEIKLNNNLVIIENRLNKIRADLIKNQNQAKEEEQKKNDLIVYMAHDLKTPLTSVIGYLTLLTEEKNISKELQEKYLNIVLDKALRLEDLTNQFFDITRYNLKDMPINKSNIDLSYLIDQLIDECYPMLEQRKLKVEITKPSKLNYFGDGEKLARAFENLLKNAINYSYENTNIEIIMEQQERIHILFRNKGDKIPEYKLNKLFEKFYRADESRTSSTGGAGLGLAITKQIIELHGGSISVKNNDEYIQFEIIL